MERINAQNVNVLPSRTVGSASSSGSIFGSGFPQIPRWVGIVAVAATTALGAAGCYYYFYSKSSSKTPAKTEPKSGKPLKQDLNDLKALGNEYFKNQDFTKAIECYTKAIEKGDQTPERLSMLYQNRAAVFEKLGDKLQVINECTLALKLQPTYVKALARRSKAYSDTGFLEEALEDITALCLLQHFQEAKAVQKADELLKELGTREAKKIMKTKQPSEPSRHSIYSFLRSFQDDPISKLWRGESSLQNGESANHNSNSGDEIVLSGYLKAVELLKKNKFSDIIKLCTEEINSPDSQYLSESYLLRGTFMYLWGYSNGVVEDFKIVLENSNASDELKTSAWIKTGLYVSHWQWESNEEFWKEAFENAAKLSPQNVDVYHQWCQQLLLRGQFEEAQEKSKKAVEFSDTFPLAHATKSFLDYRLGLINEDHQQIGVALMEFAEMDKKFSDCPDIFNYYGQILMEMQRFDEALEVFNRVLKMDPTNTSVIVHRAMCKAQRSGGLELDASAYVKELRDSLKIDDKNGFVWETLASLETQAKNQAGAEEAISRALSLAKTFPEIAMVSALRIGTEMQFKVKTKLNMI